MQFQFKQVAVEALAYALPPEVWTSAAIEEKLEPLYRRLKLPQGRLELMTGIRERRFWPIGTQPSTVAAEAGQAVLQKVNCRKDEIDLLIHASVCRDCLEPATAAYVHGNLGLPPSTQIFDLSNACLGFLNALTVAGGMLESGLIRRALIVSGENGRPLLEHTLQLLSGGNLNRNEIKPFFANLTIGAGAVAAVLCRADEAPPHAPRLLGGVTLTDSSANELCRGNAVGTGGLEMQTDAEALLKAGIQVARSTWSAFRETTGWNVDSIDRILCHQVGRQHQRQLLEALEIPLEKDFSTYPTLGNVGSVSLPITLAMALEQEALRPGQRAGLLGIGSGLVCMMLALQC